MLRSVFLNHPAAIVCVRWFVLVSSEQISALREWMAQLGLRETVKVGNAGKWKTATQASRVFRFSLLDACFYVFAALRPLPV